MKRPQLEGGVNEAATQPPERGGGLWPADPSPGLPTERGRGFPAAPQGGGNPRLPAAFPAPTAVSRSFAAPPSRSLTRGSVITSGTGAWCRTTSPAVSVACGCAGTGRVPAIWGDPGANGSPSGREAAWHFLSPLAVSEEQCLYQIYIDELYGGLQKPNEDEKKK